VSEAQPENAVADATSTACSRGSWRTWTSAAIIAAVALGIALRFQRFGLNFPIWWNEAFLAVNFLHRDYHQLLHSLDYNQVCPPLFLWAEKAVVDLLGFREWTLRLVPLVSGLAALVMFARLARTLLPASAAFLSVLMLAVAFHPVRLSAETKPYASDLLASVALLSIAVQTLDPARRARSIAWLALFAPIALGFSYPAVFVIAALTLALVPQIARKGTWTERLAFTTFLVTSTGTFLLIQRICMNSQARVAARAGMADGWLEAFPASWRPGDLLRWLADTHTGPIFAFPAGDEGLVSIITLTLMTLGAVGLARQRRTELAALLLLPFALSAAAAALGRYPYGGHPRITQYLVPAIALLSASGLNRLLARLSRASGFSRPYRLAALALVALGVAPAIGDITQPYRSATDRAAREFARGFWPRDAGDPPVLCLRRDLGILPWESPNPEVPVYLCNQAIYSKRGRAPRSAFPPPPHLERRTSRHIQYVAYYSPGLESLDVQPVRRWHAELREAGIDVSRTDFDLDHWGSRPARVVVFDCRPASQPGSDAG
jgi:hypothetical protein